jgi:6-phosphofructokinase 2
MKSIVTLTLNPTIDINAAVDHVVPERKLRCHDVTREPGGGGINVARAIRKLGGEATAIYTSGGSLGELLGELLDDEGIPRLAIEIDERTRENVHILESSTGSQYRFGMPGPTMTDGEIEAVEETIRGLDPVPDFLVLSGSLPPGVAPDTYGRIVEAARERSIRVIVDTSGEALRASAEARPFLMKPNIDEVGALIGDRNISARLIEGAAKKLIASGKVEVLVISLGAGGALFADATMVRRITAPTVRIASKVGAGDSMVAGMTLALARGYDPLDAAAFGVASGAAAVMTPGTELSRREDAERLFLEVLEDLRR